MVMELPPGHLLLHHGERRRIIGNECCARRRRSKPHTHREVSNVRFHRVQQMPSQPRDLSRGKSPLHRLWSCRCSPHTCYLPAPTRLVQPQGHPYCSACSLLLHTFPTSALPVRYSKGWFKGFFPALFTTLILPLGGFALLLPPTRRLIAKRLPGDFLCLPPYCRRHGIFFLSFFAVGERGHDSFLSVLFRLYGEGGG